MKVDSQTDLRAYLEALIETPANIILVLLDIVTIVAVFRWVVDGLEEGLVVSAFLVVVHGGHYLIFRKQRAIITDLAGRIAEQEHHGPQLSLFFLSEKQAERHLVISLPSLPQTPDFDELARRETEHLESTYQEACKESSPSGSRELARLMKLSIHKRLKTAEKYRKECDDYLELFVGHHRDSYNRELRTARTRSICFILKNDGGAPSKDVVILLHFPDVIYFPSLEERLELRNLSEPPKPPTLPSPFEFPFDDLIDFPDLRSTLTSQLTIPPLRGPDIRPSNVRGPFIEHKDSTETRYEITNLMHGFEVELDPVRFLITEPAIGKSWSLAYSIHAANLRECIEDSLVLEIRLL